MIRRVASSPSSSGMRMSISTTSGRERARPASTASRAVGGLADDLDVGSASRIMRKPGAHERLVVGEQDADHHRAPHAAAAARNDVAAARRGPASSVPP